MNTPHSKKGRRAVAAVTVTAGLVLAVAGCGGGGGDDSNAKPPTTPTQSESGGGQGQEPRPEDPGQQELASVKDGDVTVVIKSAARDQGGFLTVSGEIRNGGADFWNGANWKSDERELSSNGASLAGATLVDAQGKKKYLVLRDTQGRCLCTKFEGGGVDTGETTSWYAQFPAPPEGTSKVTFQVGGLPPAAIELSEGE